jgi:LacI family transcriptional regulator
VTQRVTLGHVAASAGVGKTTVSDILNRNITAKYPLETRNRVYRAVEELGYLPSRAAQQLVKGRSGQVGLFLTRDFSNPYFARVAHLAQQNFAKAGYRMQLALSTGQVTEEAEADLIRQLRIDGIEALLIGPVYEPVDILLHQSIFRGSIPIVTFGGDLHAQGFDQCDCVALDAHAGLTLAVSHLQRLGHSSIGYLFAPAQRTQDQQSHPMKPVLVNAGINPNWIIDHNDTGDYDDFRNQTDAFVARFKATPTLQRPTAIVCLNDQIALCLLASMTAAGLSVPGDLSIVGCDNLPGSAHFTPALTTIDNRADLMIESAVRLVTHRLDHPDRAAVAEKITPRLIERQSTGSPIHPVS